MKNIVRIILTLALIATLGIAATATTAATDGGVQVVVCKYVSIPGEAERLQTGQNPIVVSQNALEGKGFDGTFPFAFEDAQGNSIAIRYAVNSHDGDISECPGYVAPSPEPTEGVPSSEPSVTPTSQPTDVPPSDSPSDSPQPTKCSACGAAHEPSLPNTAMEPSTATGAPEGRTGLLLLAALLALVLSITMLPDRERNRR